MTIRAVNGSSLTLVSESESQQTRVSNDVTTNFEVGEAWARFDRNNNSNGSSGAPAQVAIYNPHRSVKPEMNSMRTRAELEAKLKHNQQNQMKNRAGVWMNGELGKLKEKMAKEAAERAKEMQNRGHNWVGGELGTLNSTLKANHQHQTDMRSRVGVWMSAERVKVNQRNMPETGHFGLSVVAQRASVATANQGPAAVAAL